MVKDRCFDWYVSERESDLLDKTIPNRCQSGGTANLRSTSKRFHIQSVGETIVCSPVCPPCPDDLLCSVRPDVFNCQSEGFLDTLQPRPYVYLAGRVLRIKVTFHFDVDKT